MLKNMIQIWQKAAQHTTEGIFVTTVDGDIVWVNETFSHITGYSSAEAVGKNPRLFQYNDGTEKKKLSWRSLWVTILAGKLWRAEVTNRKKNGDLYTCIQTIVPIFEQNSTKIEYFVAIHNDITDKRSIEYNVQMRTNQLELAQDIAKLGYWEWNALTNEFHWSDRTYEIFGVEKETFNPTMENILGLISEDGVDFFRSWLNRAVYAREDFIIDIKIKNEDRIIYLNFESKCGLDENGFVINLSGIVQDITVRKLIEKKLNEQLSFVQTMIEHNPNALYYKDVNNRFIGCNLQFEKLYNVDRKDIIGKTNYEVWGNRYNKKIEEIEFEAFESNHPIQTEIFSKNINKDLIFSISSYGDGDGESIGIVGTIIDISERKQNENQIRFMAFHDSLTGLANRSNIYQQLETLLFVKKQETHRHNDSDDYLSILFLDLDHFKNINDTMGHDIGDLLLKQASSRIQSCLRKDDTLGRLGGDEFVILCQTKQPETIAQKIISEMATPFDLNGNLVYIGVSIGIAIYPKDGDTTKELMKNADLALYKAKEDGRNTFHFFTEQMNMTILERRQIEDDMRAAIENKQFELYYQPRVALNETGYEVASAECLIRWNHPTLGLIFPNSFINIAELTGLIIPLSEWVIEESIKSLSLWENAQHHPVILSINISPAHFKTSTLVSYIKTTLEKYNVSPCYLEIEITENVLLERSEQIMENIRELKFLGVKMAIDDFGTGYSSMNYLRKFNVNCLKIDKSFVDDLGINHDSELIVNAIIGLAKNLKIRCVAEGVETISQLEYLENEGCDEIQGWYFSKAITENKFLQYVREFNKI
jgi:diguanylate cyclase (GGDEF)-like protein/PAS domain S-box-containing protein